MRFIIRADGNKQIAMGHVMRCLSIADALKEKGGEAVFVTAGDETEELIRTRGYQNHILNADYRNLEKELTGFREFVREFRADCILTDSYYVTETYMEELGKLAVLAYIDDLGEKLYPVNVLINYNIYGNDMDYRDRYRSGNISLPDRFMLGCSYAPLRKEFERQEESSAYHATYPEDMVSNVLITTGGGDSYNAAGYLCSLLKKDIQEGLHGNIHYHVVCGPFSEYKDELKRLCGASGRFTVHENVTHMRDLMKECQIAVTAAGSTMYELCSMGIPAACFYFADNQRRLAETFDRLAGVRNAGDIRSGREQVLAAVLCGLTELENNLGLRHQVRDRMMGLTDGRGAKRIAAGLTQAAGQRISYEEKRS